MTPPAADTPRAPTGAQPGTDPWTAYGQPLAGRLMLGTAGYPSPAVLDQALLAARPAVVTVGLRRVMASAGGSSGGGGGGGGDNGVIAQIRRTCATLGARLLPNTAGCRTAREAVLLAEMARELFDTPWIKLEVTGDDLTLQPDPFELVQAARELSRAGFSVFPYCTEDLVLGQRLLDAGCELLMPWGAPIGSGQGLRRIDALALLRQRLPGVPLVIDAGLGAPSHAAAALELGYDAVLLNSAVAQAGDPVAMAGAFAQAVQAGRQAWRAGLIAPQDMARASTPVGSGPILIGAPA